MRPQRGRQKLLDAATELFESQGYFATTVEEITAAAGVSKGLVYNYFSSKEELLVALIDDATSKMTSIAEVPAEGGSLQASLIQLVDRYFEFLKSHRRFLKLQLTLMLMPELRSVVAEPQRRRAELLLDETRKRLDRAGVAGPKKRARLLLAILDGVALHYLCIYESYPLAAMKPVVLGSIQDLCQSPAPTESLAMDR